MRGSTCCMYLAIVLLAVVSSNVFAYSGGDGLSEATAYLISNAADLTELRNTPTDWTNKYFVLTTNLNLSGITFDSALIAPDTDVADDYQGTPFTGVFDGGGHVINHLNISATSNFIGLFGQIGSGGQVRNLGLVNANINGWSYVGGLAANNAGTIHSCYVTGTVNGKSFVGGLVGWNSNTIDFCYAVGEISGNSSSVGGLAGYNYLGIITSSYAAGTVSGTDFTGGLVGAIESGTLNSCCATGTVNGTGFVGGLVGWIDSGTLNSCYATGTVNGTDMYIGGLAGSDYYAVISSCYATGDVNGTEFVGGLIGEYLLGSISSCYATGMAGGTGSVGGLTGTNGDDNTVRSCFWDIETSGNLSGYSGKGLTTAQMKTMSIYQNAGWAEKGWIINDGMDYPRLSWEGTAGVDIPAEVIPFVGSGDANDPYLIQTAQDFARLSWYAGVLDKHFKLEDDLDLNGIPLYPIGDLEIFSGVFDGNGHTISNALIHQPDNHYIGLFKSLDSGGQIKNLGLINVNIQGMHEVGGLAGNNAGAISFCYATGIVSGGSNIGGLVGSDSDSGTIRFCHAAATVNGYSGVGGLVGWTYYGTISSCYATGAVSGTQFIGGLAGHTFCCTIHSCYATGTVNGTGDWAGGLVGYQDHGTIRSCYAEETVNGTGGIGGLVGCNFYGTIHSCYATGAASGVTAIGGLAGQLSGSSSIIEKCYSTGRVVGTVNTGGFAGYISKGTILDSFWDTETSQTTDGVGNVNPDPEGVMGKTTAQMKSRSTFTSVGWDFTNETNNGTNDYWRMCSNGIIYPKLNWESIDGDFACPAGVDSVDLDYFFQRWLFIDCTADNNFCGGADLNATGNVDLADFAILSQHWLEGIE